MKTRKEAVSAAASSKEGAHQEFASTMAAALASTSSDEWKSVMASDAVRDAAQGAVDYERFHSILLALYAFGFDGTRYSSEHLGGREGVLLFGDSTTANPLIDAAIRYLKAVEPTYALNGRSA